MSKLLSLEIDHPEEFRPTFSGTFSRAFRVLFAAHREVLLCVVLLFSGVWLFRLGGRWVNDDLFLFTNHNILVWAKTLSWIWTVWVSLFFSMVVFRTLRAVDPSSMGNRWLRSLKVLPWVALQTIVVAVVGFFGLLFLIIPGIWVFVCCSLATCVLLFERSDGMLGISRSADLTVQYRKMIFSVVSATFAGEWILSRSFEVLLGATGWWSTYALVAMTGEGVSLMIAALMMTVIYHDIRLARQEFDDLGPEFYSEYFADGPLGSDPTQQPLTSNI